MGLSSSQGRLLMLTSRMSDIELQEMVISHRQNRLALEGQEEAKEYMEATSNYTFTIDVTDSNEAGGYKTQPLTYANMTKMGYLAVNSKDQIYLQKDENGEWIIPQDLDGNPLVTIDQTTGKAVINNQQFDIVDGTEYLKSSEVIQNSLMNGTLFIIDTNAEENQKISPELLEGNTSIKKVLDTSDDAEAQSKHEYQLAVLERKESQLEMDMQQLETQHEAILKEYESVKKVISNNVERTFKLFSNG